MKQTFVSYLKVKKVILSLRNFCINFWSQLIGCLSLRQALALAIILGTASIIRGSPLHKYMKDPELNQLGLKYVQLRIHTTLRFKKPLRKITKQTGISYIKAENAYL